MTFLAVVAHFAALSGDQRGPCCRRRKSNGAGDGRRVAQSGRVKKLTHEARDLYRRPLLVDELKRFDAAVIDPPRAGAEAQVERARKSGSKRSPMFRVIR